MTFSPIWLEEFSGFFFSFCPALVLHFCHAIKKASRIVTVRDVTLKLCIQMLQYLFSLELGNFEAKLKRSDGDLQKQHNVKEVVELRHVSSNANE